MVKGPVNLTFPDDHLAHPEYGIEWWYLTANLKDVEQHDLWLQWTLFRVRSTPDANLLENSNTMRNSWSDGQFYMAHFSLHKEKEHFSKELFASGGVGNVVIDEQEISINNWRLQKSESGLPDGLEVNFIDGKTALTVALSLTFDTQPQYLLHGDNGYSLKHPKTKLASHYYSLPNIEVSGDVSIGTDNYQMNGSAWYDHEWSSAFLSEDFSGWTWFSMHLDNGEKLSLFTLAPSSNSRYGTSWYGAFIAKNGQQTFLSDEDMEILETDPFDSPIGRLPQSWRLNIPRLSKTLNIRVKKPDQISPFSIPYYEGAIEIFGTNSGIGFVEMTR